MHKKDMAARRTVFVLSLRFGGPSDRGQQEDLQLEVGSALLRFPVSGRRRYRDRVRAARRRRRQLGNSL